ncbi:MAG: YggS family pyridoxal phosphate-dependent enzyme [bacterium]|nr:YggS family pyridoxal phosphate-dependent enzyme [bacterium]
MSIEDNLRLVRKRIEKAALKTNRDPASIKLVAITKEVTPPEIIEAINAGIDIIGENKIQEAERKYSHITHEGVEWHLVGHLQRNKVKRAIRIFNLIHSVDSLRLAQEINLRAEEIGRQQRILIQVNTSGEEQKFGFSVTEVKEAVEEITKLPFIKIEGLMTIAPLVDNPEEVRPYFRKLAELGRIFKLSILSMGMTNDFEVAIEEGANMVRIGRAIFGKRLC